MIMNLFCLRMHAISIYRIHLYTIEHTFHTTIPPPCAHPLVFDTYVAYLKPGLCKLVTTSCFLAQQCLSEIYSPVRNLNLGSEPQLECGSEVVVQSNDLFFK
ncbi:hypothetical protein OCU04_006039 [Sclerotinia nivalis]|uniref:Uncharacterized protein n=1 Tax=Sclerotinia nivalis TaxID=352851 RepID=A0A9X0AM60_9HELO|nr:hypothetical protein OCU04_006039 [Sclerotinia nivalis]